MTIEKPLYEDAELKITYLLNNKGEISSSEEHELFISDSKTRYTLQKGVLKRLAESRRPELAKILKDINPEVLKDLKSQELTPDAVGVAAHQAIIESERRFEDYISRNY